METMEDHRGALTPKQSTLLAQLRKNIQDLVESNPQLDDNSELVRWARAREWDLKKSEKMLRDHLAWRKSYGADTLMEWEYPDLFSKYFAGNYFGVDKQGYPTWYELTGRIDLKGMLMSASKSDIIKYRIYLIEYMFKHVFPECSKKAGRKIDQCSVIVDMEGTGLKYLSMPIASIYRELLTTVEANYPESLRTCYVINAPAILPLFYNMVKPFLAEYTRTKIRVLGSNWKQVLLLDYNADQLPVHWGGSRTDPDGDPHCKSQICLGGIIPETLYMKNVFNDNYDMSQFKTINISRGKLVKLEYQVDVPGSLIRWNFWTDGKDVAFGVYRRTASTTSGKIDHKLDDKEIIVATSRVNSHLCPESGSVECHQTGTYVVCFDNSYSWVNAKKLSYFIDVILPDKDHVPEGVVSLTNF